MYGTSCYSTSEFARMRALLGARLFSLMQTSWSPGPLHGRFPALRLFVNYRLRDRAGHPSEVLSPVRP